jgi:nucleoside-diphosphate-sugar epimerase
MSSGKRKIFVTGAGGYVGARLVPRLLEQGYEVLAADTYWYGKNVLMNQSQENLEIIELDIRNQSGLAGIMEGVTDVIHLACISNDPSFDLNPELGKSINLDAFKPLVQISKKSGVKRFIYASSSSVYGVKEEERVTEDLSLKPLTDYSKYKAMCEEILFDFESSEFACTVLRPATVCGWSPRQRFDLSVNILTNHAINNKRIKVFGGSQYRPNIHIEDMVDAYLLILSSPIGKINGEIFNVGADNLSMDQIAEQVAINTGIKEIIHEATDDLRSYRIDSTKITSQLGFDFKRNVGVAVRDLVDAFNSNKFNDPLNNPLYFNIKRMKDLDVH